MLMKIRKIDIPLSVFFLILFSCTDIYLVSGVKMAYVFCIPIAIKLIKRNVRLEKKDGFLLLWYLSYFLSADHIISMADFWVVLIGQLVLFVIYFYFGSIRNYKTIQKCTYWFQKSLYLMVVIGSVQLVLYYAVGSTWGISHVTHGVGLPRMSGLSREPDWYGVICMMAFIFMAINILSHKYFWSKKIDIAVAIVALLMLILSLTRAAWVGLFSSICIFLTLKTQKRFSQVLKKRFKKYLFIIVPCAVIGCFGLYISGNPAFLKLMQRLNVFQWASNDGGAANSRSYAIGVMLYYFKQHPFTGNGVGSMNAIASNKTLLASLGYMYEINAGRGNANIIVTNLFDVGIFGTICLGMFFVLQIKEMIADYKKNQNTMQLAYLMILVGLLVDFQFNNGLRFPYVWIILGLSTALSRIDKMNACIH